MQKRGRERRDKEIFREQRLLTYRYFLQQCKMHHTIPQGRKKGVQRRGCYYNSLTQVPGEGLYGAVTHGKEWATCSWEVRAYIEIYNMEIILVGGSGIAWFDVMQLTHRITPQ
jgi:hypothetical protein